MRKKEERPRRARKHSEPTTYYTNKRGMENRIVSFRMNEILYERLYAYASHVKRDPSACIREAVTLYLRDRWGVGPLSGHSSGPAVSDDPGQSRALMEWVSWLEKNR